MKASILGLILACFSFEAIAQDKVVVLSPHRKSIQDEFVPKFKEWYKDAHKKDVIVEWLDQGGTSSDVRFLRAKFGSNKDTAGVDIFWGGGTSTFLDLQNEGFLAPYTLSKDLQAQIPATAAGMPLYDKDKNWYASAMSSFGIFYNKKLIAMYKMPVPATWADLAKPEYKGQVTLTDPRYSGSANTMNTIILQSMGWDAGWTLLTELAGNTYQFTHSSSDPIKAVVSGNSAISLAIDFYALAKIGDLGSEALGFVLPEGQTVIDPDPIAIVRGAPNRTVAERFVEYVLSAEAQKLLVLPKGEKDGPKFAALGRMAVNTETYTATEGRRMSELNPLQTKQALQLDTDKAAKLKDIFNDLIGATMVDTHKELKAAWEQIVKNGMKPAEIAEFGKPPVTEKEALELVPKWNDDVFRNQTINEWVKFARTKYSKLSAH